MYTSKYILHENKDYIFTEFSAQFPELHLSLAAPKKRTMVVNVDVGHNYTHAENVERVPPESSLSNGEN